MFTHISEHVRLEIQMDLRDLRAFSPPLPASGRGGRGVRGRALTWKPPVQLFVYNSETQLGIEFTIKKPIKTQCKTPHPQPLSPSTGRGEQDQKMWVKMRLAACATGISKATARLSALSQW